MPAVAWDGPRILGAVGSGRASDAAYRVLVSDGDCYRGLRLVAGNGAVIAVSDSKAGAGRDAVAGCSAGKPGGFWIFFPKIVTRALFSALCLLCSRQKQQRGTEMTTAFQERQAIEVRQETQRRIAELKAVGAVARIGFYHYPDMHTNVNTMDSVSKYGRSMCIPGDAPMSAIIGYAKALWGHGRLRSEGRIVYSDGTFSESFLVFTSEGQ